MLKEAFGRQFLDLTLNVDGAKLVFWSFFDCKSDEKSIPVRGQFGNGGDNTEIRIPSRKIEFA